VPEPPPVGVGIDLESYSALGRLDDASVQRAALRWLSGPELAWCGSQTSLASSLVTVLSCKEAAFKAWPGVRAAHDVRLESLEGKPWAGSAWALREGVVVEVSWRRWRDQVLAVAVAHRRAGRPC